MFGLRSLWRGVRAATQLWRWWTVAATGVAAASSLAATPLLGPGVFLFAAAALVALLLPGLAVRVLRRLPPYQRFLARMFDSAACHAAESAFFASRKRALFAHLSALGDDPAVLDLGAGSGVNARHLPPNVKRITAVEPNQQMFPALRAAAAAAGVGVHAIRGHAEKLPLADATFDAVLSTHVLCTVDSPQRALAEVARVLKPGGLFLFLEHEAAGAMPAAERAKLGIGRAAGRGRLRWLPAAAQQRLFEGPWRLLTGGCRLTRRTGALVADASASVSAPNRTEAETGRTTTKAKPALFEALELERFQLPEDAACFPGMWLIAPHAAGVARAPGGGAAAARRAAAGERAGAAEAASAAAAARAVPEGRPMARAEAEEARIVAEREQKEEKGKGKAADVAGEEEEEEEAGGGVAGVLRGAAEAAAVGGAVAVAAATLTAATAPALMRRAYTAARSSVD